MWKFIKTCLFMCACVLLITVPRALIDINFNYPILNDILTHLSGYLIPLSFALVIIRRLKKDEKEAK